MSVKTNIKDFYGRVIGTVVEENNGDKTIKDFYRSVLSAYISAPCRTGHFAVGSRPQ